MRDIGLTSAQQIINSINSKIPFTYIKSGEGELPEVAPVSLHKSTNPSQKWGDDFYPTVSKYVSKANSELLALKSVKNSDNTYEILGYQKA